MINVNESAPVVVGTPVPARRGGGALLGASTVATGLAAGVFYAFACAIMVALAGADDRTFIDVMQRVNDNIENPVFFASFFGALVLRRRVFSDDGGECPAEQ